MAELRYLHGQFVWRELATPDLEAASRFHGALLGWTYQDQDMGPLGTYRLIQSGGRMIGGMYRHDPPSFWCSYVSVPSVDEAVARAQAQGGALCFGPQDLHEVGRMAVVADRAGAALSLFRSARGDDVPQDQPPAGAFCWETLVTPDPVAAASFWGEVVGWRTGSTPNGEGKVFTAGPMPIADLQPASPGSPSYWATYVAVNDVAAVRDEAARLGGHVRVPWIEVPKVGVVAVIADPGGASLGLFKPNVW